MRQFDPNRPEKRFDIIDNCLQFIPERFGKPRLIVIYNESHERVAKYMNACDVMVLAVF